MAKIKHGSHDDRHENTVYAARTVLQFMADFLPRFSSAIDLGCGVGTWLSVAQALGAQRILGIDGPWVERSLLEIPPDSFLEHDLEKKLEFEERYDLCISLEVAEHVKPECAASFVESLTGASDFILFSAAIPFQSGNSHVNCQWPEYWADIFGQQGYQCIDLLRMRIWNDERIPPHYRQNMMAFVKRERIFDLKADTQDLFFECPPLSIVHPLVYTKRAKEGDSVRGGLKLARRAAKEGLRRRLKKLGLALSE